MGWQASEWLVDMGLVGAAAAGPWAAYRAAQELARRDPAQLAPTESDRRQVLEALERRATADGR